MDTYLGDGLCSSPVAEQQLHFFTLDTRLVTANHSAVALADSFRRVFSFITMPPHRTPYRALLLNDIEDFQKYIVGGYHPVNIGDWLGDGDRRFKVLYKLGSGGFSTVWWTKSSADQRYYAVKVMRADASNGQELQVMHQLDQQNVKHPNINVPLTFFHVEGPNGTHLCLVFPLLGPSLKQMWKRITGSSQHRVCKEIVSGLAFLHDQGICHGDLTPSNILFELPDAQSWTETELHNMFGPPQTAELRLHDGSYSQHSPKEVVQAINFSSVDENSLGSIRISDFGQSFNADKAPNGLGIPLPYFPPEICFGYLPSKMSDMWSMACIIFEVQTWRPLVPMMFESFELLIGTLRFTLGLLPASWKGRYSSKYSKEYSGERAPEIWWDENVPLHWPFVSLVQEGTPHLSPGEKKQLLHLLQVMLAFEPSDRMSATEVLNHPWICETSAKEDEAVVP